MGLKVLGCTSNVSRQALVLIISKYNMVKVKPKVGGVKMGVYMTIFCRDDGEEPVDDDTIIDGDPSDGPQNDPRWGQGGTGQ